MNRDLNDQQLSNIYDDLVRENQNVLAEIKREDIGSKKEKLLTKSITVINNLLANVRKLQTIKKQMEDL
jgi:hypothetical protein|tara:strand:- start:802 stop:1008 length:207 start_codon:yes stop_codon:yes gene_type:complete